MTREEAQANVAAYPPGSDRAWLVGCTCPVLDNHHGVGLFVATSLITGKKEARYWISELCPLHGQLQKEPF